MLQELNSYSDPAPPKGPSVRKRPVQARSAATVDAIGEAVIQVLMAGGAEKLTTTRVAKRAGVSVGTLYQYFPDRQALLYAVLVRHLEDLVRQVETACRALAGSRLDAAVDGLIGAYIDAKVKNPDASRVLYGVASIYDTRDVLADVRRRLSQAVRPLLANLDDTRIDDPDAVTFMILAALAGAARTVIERGAAPPPIAMFRAEMTRMCKAYLYAAQAVSATMLASLPYWSRHCTREPP